MLTSVMQTLQGPNTATRVTFGLFEADLKSGELRKAGNRVKLQALPFKVLTVLLANAGEVVSRDELQMSVWGPDVIVDFEHSLSNAIKKLREALGDSADNPRFIETLSRRGFRFIAPVSFLDSEALNLLGGSALPRVNAPLREARPVPEPAVLVTKHTPPVASSPHFLLNALFFLIGGLLVGTAVFLWSSRRSLPALPRVSQITQDGAIYASKDHLLGAVAAFVTDGARLFTPSTENGEVVLSQISLPSGTRQIVPLLSQIASPEVEDVSPDGTKLLVKSNLASAVLQPLWIVTIDGGSAFRVSNVLAQAAVWIPDGKGILYATGNRLVVISLNDGKSTLFAEVSGHAFWPRWSPDGKILRFTIIDPLNHTSALWEISRGEKAAHPILNLWSDFERQCCGTWTADGKFFVFEVTKDGTTDLWKANASLDSSPMRITNGPLNYKAPAAAREGETIFFVGQDVHSLLERFDSARKEYVPQPGFLAAADHISFSRDGHWVSWVDPDHRLWRARADGTDKVLLTPAFMWVFMAAWSPDNTHITFMSREPGRPWQIYLVNTDGGTPERLLQEDRNIGDPSFSADGKRIAFGTVPGLIDGGKGRRSIQVIELATHRVTEVANSEGLYSPRWSPDGRYIVAITLDQKKLMLYDTTALVWRTLAMTSAANPVWSKDSKAIYIHAYRASNRPIMRLSIPDGKMEEVANLSNFPGGSITHADFAGLTLADVPLMHAEISSGNLYSVDLKQR